MIRPCRVVVLEGNSLPVARSVRAIPLEHYIISHPNFAFKLAQQSNLNWGGRKMKRGYKCLVPCRYAIFPVVQLTGRIKYLGKLVLLTLDYVRITSS